MKKPKILVTQQPLPSLQAAYKKLHEYFGAQVDFKALTEVQFLSLPQFRIYKPTICEHTAFLFTSRVVIDGFFKLAQTCSIFLAKETKYFLGSESLQSYLCKYIELRKRKIFYGKQRLEDLFPTMYKHKKEKFLFPSSVPGRPDLRAFFEKKKYHYTELPIYQNVPCNLSELEPNNYDVIVFFSPFSVKAFATNFPNHTFGKTKIAAFNTSTIQEIQAQNWEVTISNTARKYPSIVETLIAYFDEN